MLILRILLGLVSVAIAGFFAFSRFDFDGTVEMRGCTRGYRNAVLVNLALEGAASSLFLRSLAPGPLSNHYAGAFMSQVVAALLGDLVG